MKKTLLSLAAIFAIALFSSNLMAQATASATATATIVAPITITRTGGSDMNFGNVAVTGTAGTVTLAPAGTRTNTVGVTLPNVTGTVTAAKLIVGGSGTYTYAITLPSTDYTITNSTGTGGETMTINAFTSTPSGTGALVAGTQDLLIGATLIVAAAQVAGVYTNETGFSVTVNYN